MEHVLLSGDERSRIATRSEREARRHSEAITKRLAQLEEEQAEAAQQLEALEAELCQATVKRPTAAQVQALWTQVLDLWDLIKELDRETLLRGIVRRVLVQEKGRVLVELSPVVEDHGLMLALSADLGAGVGFEPTASRL